MRVSCLQLAISEGSKEENLDRALSLFARAPVSDLYLLPELWPTGYFAFDRYESDAEGMDGPLVHAFQKVAFEREAWVFMGTFVEREGSHLYNTALLIDPVGAVSVRYRKIHLFGFESEERRLVTPGRCPVTAATPWGTAGLSICYDLRFPELYRALLDHGAGVFLVASAWPAARLEAWHLFCRARAHENLAFLIACNAAGESRGHRLAGHSAIVDPWGRVLAEGGGEEAVLSFEIDPEEVERARGSFPALEDR
ncbi:carbon-nitrogen family hydrolase [bacterium]|nr:carbon-nitrogen family hydrolase [bacterium]